METNRFKNLSKKPSEQEPAVALLIQFFFHLKKKTAK